MAASRGSLLPVLLVAFALVVGGLVEGASRESSSAVRRLLDGRELRGATATGTPSTTCKIACSGQLPNCCTKKLIPGVLPSYFCANTSTDVFNCGFCLNSCAIDGETVGIACCSGICTYTLEDNNNCGFCGNKCRARDTCSKGLCSYAG